MGPLRQQTIGLIVVVVVILLVLLIRYWKFL